MQWVRKQFIVILAVFFVYTAFLFSHVSNSPRAVLGAKANLMLYEEPMAGKDPILSTIQTSQKFIDVTVYLLSDKEIINSLRDACQRGVRVRVLLEQHPFGGENVNEKTMQLLSGSCVQMRWANPSFSLTHEKTMVIDGRVVFILNQNLTTSAFVKNREYDILDADPEDVSAIEKLFTADWERTSYQLDTSHLLVSPLNARAEMVSLLTSANRTIQIEVEVLDDPSIVRTLEEKAKTVAIQIIFPSYAQISANSRVAKQLLQHGILVKTLHSPYIHAKLVLVDGEKAYVGSINLTTQSMDENREVGMLIEQPDIVAQLQTSFLADWSIAQ